MKIKNIFVLNTNLILLLLAACSTLKPTLVPTQPPPTPTALPATGVQYHFVTNKMILPTTQAQTEAFALNIDSDVLQKSDNLFGTLLTLFASTVPNLEFQSTLDQAVNDGQLVSLHVVKADDSLNDTNVAWSILQGQATKSPPRFDGSDEFVLNSTAPLNSPIVGSLTNGHFTGGPGTAQVQMLLLGQTIKVDLIGVRIEADLSANGCSNGKLGGGVTVAQFHDKLLPSVADGLNQLTRSNPAAAKTLLQLFDSDHNGSITTQELENNPLLMLAISPDLDLLDASGNFNPNQDAIKDSISIGLGFTCVPAIFTAPGD